MALCLLKSYPHASGGVEEKNNNEVSDDFIMDVQSNIIPGDANDDKQKAVVNSESPEPNSNGKIIKRPKMSQNQKLGNPMSKILAWFNNQLEQKPKEVAVSKTGAWQNKNFHHVVDHKFGSSLVHILKENHIASVTDLGCGTGAYVKMIAESNIEAQGFDGNPETKILDRSGGLCVGQNCQRKCQNIGIGY